MSELELKLDYLYGALKEINGTLKELVKVIKQNKEAKSERKGK